MSGCVRDKMTRAAGHNRLPAPLRRSEILKILRRDGFASVADISGALGVSEMTVRRDLDALSEDALLERTFGGAMPRDGYDAHEPALERRLTVNAAAKAAIARRGEALIGEGETLGLDVGSTTLALAERLVSRADLRIFTSSLRAAAVLATGRSPVHVPGGEIRAVEMSIVGASAVAFLRGFDLDRTFLGVSGISERGIYDYSVEDTEVKRALIEEAQRVVVLCDSAKFSRRALARIAPLDAIDILITDAPPPPTLAAALDAAGVEVIVADTETS